MRYLPALFALAIPAFAADLSGNWEFQGDVQQNPIAMKCALRQDGAKLSGTCQASDGRAMTIAGEAAQSNVSFTYDVDYQGTKYTLQYTGKVDDAGTGITGNIEVAGASGTFSAKKV